MALKNTWVALATLTIFVNVRIIAFTYLYELWHAFSMTFSNQSDQSEISFSFALGPTHPKTGLG